MTLDAVGITPPLAPGDARMATAEDQEDSPQKGLEAGGQEGAKGPDDSFQDQTLIGHETPSKAPSSIHHTKSVSKSSSSSQRPREHTSTANEIWDPTSWNLLQGTPGYPNINHNTTLAAADYDYDQTQDVTLIAERGADEKDITDAGLLKVSDGGDGFKEGNGTSDLKPSASPAVSRRPSALQLKPPSPQPWDLIDPPEDNMKGMSLPNGSTAYSPSTSQKFAIAQRNLGRSLKPKSSYYFGPPAPDSAYATPPTGRIGVHHPREILRVERDYTGGEVIQFAPIYPLELEGRLTPTQFLESMNAVNEVLISAHSLRHAFLDNIITVMSLQLSRLFMSSHFQRELRRLRNVIEDLNTMLFNPVGLNILWPGDVAFLFLEIEYY